MARKDEISADEPIYLQRRDREASRFFLFRLRGEPLSSSGWAARGDTALRQITEARLTYEPRSFAQRASHPPAARERGKTCPCIRYNFRSDGLFADRQEEAYAAS